MESNLKLYSLGIVVEDKPVGTDIVLVTPIETLNIQTPGKIKDSSTTFEGTIKDTSGKNFKTEINATNYLRAKWLSFGQSNRITAPDVVKSETILLFKFGDIDEYYWTTIFREVELRRQETVLYGYSNLKSGISAFDKTTSYWLEVDTKNKHIKLHTSANDGELTEYDIVINTKAGTVSLTDKVGNSIVLNSRQSTLSANIINSINATAGNSINIKAPTVNIEGNVNIKGNVNITGNTSVRGGLSSSGNMTSAGNITASGSIIDGGGNTANHSH